MSVLSACASLLLRAEEQQKMVSDLVLSSDFLKKKEVKLTVKRNIFEVIVCVKLVHDSLHILGQQQ